MPSLMGSSKGKGGLHLKTRRSGGKYTIGAKDSGGPAKRGRRIILGSSNSGTSKLMASTK